ncbi:MAG: hypothetical protein PWQ88_701 [Candidatus Methanomethylophilaceae archaeon]|nr:hypothetical protein [Candidatus Methanomethylophilaceae archaeon]MDI3542209.1 hypothetical protein [Candidatus Methanomethylophilaceae archaeon]
MRERYCLVAKMPNEPGSLHRAAEILKRHDGNIERIQYDQRIDPNTVFFEVVAEEASFQEALAELDDMGYLRRSLPVPAYLKFDIRLPNVPGTLFEFLDCITDTGSNIAYLDYDETIPRGEPLRVGIVLDDGSKANELLDRLKSRYPLEILEHSNVNEDLDNTVFYVRFAQQLRPLIPEDSDEFLMQFLNDSNHIAQELRKRGLDMRQVLNTILNAGYMLHESVRSGCAELQSLDVPGGKLYCIQFPCGGNTYIVDVGSRIMVDTGFGIYREHIRDALHSLNIPLESIDAILITHADADHCGSTGYIDAPTYMSPESLKVLQENDRSYGSAVQGSLLESFYTNMINLFSDFSLSSEIRIIEGGVGSMGGFKIQGNVRIGDVEVIALKSLGGHQAGQLFYYFPQQRLLFTGDSLINMNSLNDEKREYMSLAKVLMTSVNVDPALAREERAMLEKLIREMSEKGDVNVCPGHGDIITDSDRRCDV